MTLGDPSLAAEATDEAMARALQRWEHVSNHDRPDAWAYRTAMNWATSQLRRLALRPTRSREQLDRAGRDRLPDVDLARRLAAMDAKHRTVLVLRYFLDMTPSEIADLLGVPSGTVKSQLSRATEQLRADREVIT